MADHVPYGNVEPGHQPQREFERRMSLTVATHYLAVAAPHVLDPDRRLVEADYVPTSQSELDRPEDASVGIDDEVRADAWGLTQVLGVVGHRPPRTLHGRAIGVVLDDDAGLAQPEATMSVVSL